MNKTAIKNFAIWARRKLISDITYKAGLIGINEKGISQPLSISTSNIQFFDIGTGKPTEIVNHEIKQRDALINRIKEKESTSDYKTAYKYVIEEAAYTWFNRLIAIRFMEVNDYLPSRIRVLSSETPGKSEPDMVTNPFDTDMKFSPYETDRIIQLKDENKLDELFRMLFIKQCNKLNEVLPELFEKTSDYTEFLLNISFTDMDGIVSHLVNDIAEEDFTETVEIIGWMYQYYNTEPKDETFALLKKNVKITKERIPAATQLFTPDWIVRYMVENSLGRLWIEGHPNDGLKSEWKYYLDEAEQEEEVKIELEKIRDEFKKLNPEGIKIIDPCMGSGHILVYAFDVLMQIYESQGYTQRDAAQAIVENNLFGLDIDNRAYQLAYFAVMMKARKYDRRFLTKGITPKLYSIKESNNIKKSNLKYFGKSLNDIELNTATLQMEYLLDVYHDAKEYGSILNVDACNWELLYRFVDDYKIEGQMSLESMDIEAIQGKLRLIVSIAEVMAQKYDVVITNPPYMGSSGMNPKVSKYVKDNYADSKSDLFAVFIDKCLQMTNKNRYTAMITQHAWMFLSSYENLREKMLRQDIMNMAHLGARAFEEIGGEVVQTTSFVTRKSNVDSYAATFSRLIDYSNQQAKERAFLARYNIYICENSTFQNIPNQVIAYWIGENFKKIFNYDRMEDFGNACIGMRTGDNNKFLRLWHEVGRNKIGLGFENANDAKASNLKWFPYCKGGSFRKWYGNNDYVVNWENDGHEIKENTKRVYPQLGDNLGWKISNEQYYFKQGITWSGVGASIFGVRCYPNGMIFDSGANSFFVNDKNDYLYFAGLLNTNLINETIKTINPTINTGCGVVAILPVKYSEDYKNYIASIVKNNLLISKTNWDYFETSWGFKKHPLISLCKGVIAGDRHEMTCIEDVYNEWASDCNYKFIQLKANEEELNRIFIEIYGLQDELTPEVEDKDVTVTRIYDTKEDIPESMKGNNYVLTKGDVIKSFISYAVGCMFGRYSLDIEGLAYAGGEWNDNKYSTFIPDKDNCIPITDEEYFEDDIVGLLIAFVKKVYGRETLEENLDFIADALGNKGNTSREIIRDYFMNEFFKDHCSTYSVTGSGKRPIYWLYDSGKQNGFKALIYMHRYNADTTGIIRVYYLHKMQRIYMNEIDRMQDMIDNSTDNREISKAEKRKEKLIRQYKETKEYDEKIAHIANSRIDIDLDDGVKVNYDKVQTGKDGKKLNILAKI